MRDEHGITPLHLVAAQPVIDVSFFQLLLQHQALVIAKNNEGQTPLHLAASRGNLPVAALILAADTGSEYGTESGPGQDADAKARAADSASRPVPASALKRQRSRYRHRKSTYEQPLRRDRRKGS